MSCELIPVELTDEQKARVCGILSVGCDRQTAANFLGCSLADIRRAMERDAQFSASVCRAEAGVELLHMKTVQQAVETKQEWRASVWWLERRSPERYGSRGAGVVTTRQMKIIIAILIDMLDEELHDDQDRERVCGRFTRVMNQLDEMLRDMQPGPAASSLTNIGSLLVGDDASDHDPIDLEASGT